MTGINRRERGRHSEDLAVKYLVSKGMEVLERNFSWSGGEIDIVARDGDVLVFVEVRSLTGERVEPGETLGPGKRRRLVKSALHYLTTRQIYGKVNCRFDFLGIKLGQGKPLIEHIKNAIVLL